MSLTRDVLGRIVRHYDSEILHISQQVDRLVHATYDVAEQDVIGENFFSLILNWYHALLLSYDVKMFQVLYGYDTVQWQTQLAQIRFSVKRKVLWCRDGILQDANKCSWARLWLRLDSGATNNLTRNPLTIDIYQRMITSLKQSWNDQFCEYYELTPYIENANNV